MAKPKTKKKNSQKKRVFALKVGGEIAIYITNDTGLRVVPTHYELRDKNDKVVGATTCLCMDASLAVPAFHALKEGELAEISSLTVTSIAILESEADVA